MGPLARKRRARGSERGAAAVEFALVLPPLVMLMFGLFTSGLAYSDHLSVTNAVREGARLGAAMDYSTGATVWANSVQTRVQQVYFNANSSLPTGNVCVQLVDSSDIELATPTAQGSCGTAPGLPPGVTPGSCVVKVWVKKPAKISLLISPDWNFDIGARSVSYYGRTTGSCTAS